MKDFLGILLNTILWVLIVILLFLVSNGIYQRVAKKNDYFGFFGIGTAVVVYGSMEPNLHVNDMVLYQKKDISEYEKGDIIIYKHSEKNEIILITHRIQEVVGTEFQTKGDHNKDVDPWMVHEEDVVGRIVWRIPYIGGVVEFIKTPLGMVAAGIVVLLCIILNLSFSKHRRKKRAIDTVMGTQYIKY